MNIVLFEEPIPPGWVYPCSLADIEAHLGHFPCEDLEGLWAVGLAAATRKDCWANGRYYGSVRPFIRLYSCRDDYAIKLPAHTASAEIEAGLTVELTYGMTVDRVGRRFVCRWEPSDLRCFILEHVLAHEVGHHVFRQRRLHQGLRHLPSTRASEQFAGAYALHHGSSDQ